MNEDQEKAYVALLNNQNVFLTGKAGTGKSFTINIIYERFIKSKKNICITASTAIAAQMYSDASTVHSFAGLGYRLESVETILKNMTDVVIERLKNVQILVIDEISMLPVHVLKTLNMILKNIKKSHRLFGGCVLLVAGDFYQLTPVGEETLLFEDPFWNECEFVNVELVKNFRQNKDLIFQTHLNNVREGIFCESTLAFFRKRLEPADKHLDPSYTSFKHILTAQLKKEIEKYRVRGKGETLYRNEHVYEWYEDEYNWRKYEDDYYSAWYRKELQKKH
nr:ATP-dependent DNA helicase PIF1-like [Hydra vulgaris]